AKGSLLPAGWYADVFVLGAYLHALRNSNQLYASLRHGVMLGTATVTVAMLTVIAVLGTSLGQRSMYPAYMLVEQVHITDYLDRVELSLFSVWLPAYIIKCSVIFTAFVRCLSSFTDRQKRSGLFVKQVGWFIVITTFLAFRNVTEVFNFGNYGSILTTAVLQVPCVLAIFLLARRKRFNPHDPEQERYNQLDRKPLPGQRKKGLSSRLINIPPHRWFRMTNWLIAVMVGLLITGELLGNDVQIVARICAFFYLLLVFGAVFTTFMEMKSKKERLAVIGQQRVEQEDKSA
ncbi:MAG: GerAB/ArcD/ProY family transporter, partial [Tumebacillaceae bacterium]